MTQAREPAPAHLDPVTRCYVGIDVAKAWLDIAVRPGSTPRPRRVANVEAEWPALVEQIRAVQPQVIVLEATGGYERGVVAALGAAGLPVVVVNPRQVRDFARATGKLAKTAVLDAGVLAHCAQAVQPQPRPLTDAATQRLAALLERRSQLVVMLTAEKTRRQQAVASVRPLIEAHITWLEPALDQLTQDVDQALHTSPLWRERENLLRSVPGVGPILALTLLADLPELGTLAHNQLAALVGGAPLHRASGTARGKRMIGGGRARVRAALYMSTLSVLCATIPSSAPCGPGCASRASRQRSRWSPVCISSSRSSMPCSSGRHLGNPHVLLDVQHSCSPADGMGVARSAGGGGASNDDRAGFRMTS